MLAACGAGLLALDGVALWDPAANETFVVALLLQGVLFAVAAVAVRRMRPGRRTLLIVLGVAAALRVGPLLTPPQWSTDIYRYIWDGEVQGAGINPYRYLPADPALAALRDAAIYPNINRADSAHTIYPPAAQMAFWLATRFGRTVLGMKLALVAAEALGIWGMIRILRRMGRPATDVLLYAWNPLPIWEIANEGHVDALIVALVPLVLLAALGGRRVLTGVLMAMAVLTKFFPIVLVPAVWRRTRGWRMDWRAPAAFVAASVALYVPYLSVGAGVFGYLPGYTREENISLHAGQGFWAVDALRQWGGIDVPDLAYLAICAGILAGLALMAMARPPGSDAASLRWCRIIALAVVVSFAPHYGWYFVWPIVLLALSPWWPGFWLSLTAPLLYWSPQDGRIQLWVGAVIYGGFAALALGDLLRRRRTDLGARHGYAASP